MSTVATRYRRHLYRCVNWYMHPTNIFTCERISRVEAWYFAELTLWQKPGANHWGVGGVVPCERSPGFPELAPAKGLPRNVAAPVLDMLYPPGKKTVVFPLSYYRYQRKTTTTRLDRSNTIKKKKQRLPCYSQHRWYLRPESCQKEIQPARERWIYLKDLPSSSQF